MVGLFCTVDPLIWEEDLEFGVSNRCADSSWELAGAGAV